MKRVFVLLVLVNLGLFGWGYLHSGEEPSAEMPEAGGDLQLLAERESSEARAAPEDYAVVEPVPAEQPEESPAAGSGLEADAETGTAPQDGALQLAEAPQPPEAPASEPQAEADETTPEGESSKLRRCHALGAFEAREDAESVAARLASIGLAATLRRDVASRMTGYWVMIPPMESRAAARDMEQRLRGLGFEDIWRVVEGDMENAISLGLYSRESGANRRLDQARSHDIPAEIRTRSRNVEEFWLDFPTDRRVDLDSLKRRLTRDFPGVQIVQRDCVRPGTP